MSESRAIDQKSRRQVREDRLTNILLEAGAGSGKTQMLAERMAAGVAAGVYGIEQMAAVTFTRKAASELRGRFHLALEGELSRALDLSRRDPTANERANRVRSELANMERFFGGTIHSFCARLLRERPVESGVSPGFTELDEVQDFELRQRVWRDFIANGRGSGNQELLALLEVGIRPQDLDSAFATICANDDVDFPPGEADCPDPEPALKALERFWTELQKHLPSKIDSDTNCPIQKAALQFRGQFRVSQQRLNRPAVVASLLDTWDRKSKIIQKRWADTPAEKKRLSGLIDGLHQVFHTTTVEPYLAQWRQYVYRLSVTLLIQARDFAAAERRRLNSLNYGDLLNLTARVLRENESVRRALQQKFRYLLVDEFQDTDPVQAEILFWLAEDGAMSSAMEHKPVDWRTLPLRPGALFVVGDPKQSIYRFRRADIDIYNIVRRRFSDPAVGRVVPLTLNFRSVPRLCTWVNEIFQTRFPVEPTVHAPRFAALDPTRSDIGSGGISTLTHTCDSKDLQKQDAEKIASYIRSEVDAGRRRFRDFLILTRRRRDRMAFYADALESRNIPVEVSGAGAFGDSSEVKVLTVLLRALADSQDVLPLIAVLRGPLFGISDQELFAFKQIGGWFSLFYEPGDATPTGPISQTQSALCALRKYYRWTRILPAAAALDRILEDTGYLALAATPPRGVGAGDLLHAVDRVRQVIEEGGSLSDAADALEADSDAASEVESLPLEPGRTDVVRLMNLHKAKGLEADVVFLADPAGGSMPRVDVHIKRTALKAHGWLKIVRKSEGSFKETLLGEHRDWPAHEAEELPYLQAEEDRLLYVAATRAREVLVISRSTENLRNPAWGVLNNFLAQASELPIPSTANVHPVSPLDCSNALVTTFVGRQATAHSVAVNPSWRTTSVTEEARHIARMAGSMKFSDDDPSKVLAADSPSHRADAGQAWGTLIHGLLEHAMSQKRATAEDLQRLGMWLTVEQPQLRQVLELAVKTVLYVSKSDFWDKAKRSDCSVETPFAFTESPNAILTGVMDLLFGHEGHWQIIDYKTDVDSPELVPSYQEQLKMYERAMASIGIQGVASKIEPVRGVGD